MCNRSSEISGRHISRARFLPPGRSAASPSALPKFASAAFGIEEKQFRYRDLQHLCNLLDGFEGWGVYAALDKPQEGYRNAYLLGKPLLRDIASKPKAAEPPSELDSQVGHGAARPVSNNVVAHNSK